MNKKSYVVGLSLLTVCFSIAAHAARPSINELNTRVNQLEAENTQQDIQITDNANDISTNASDIQTNIGDIDQLQAEINSQQAQIDAIPKSVKFYDANGAMIGDAQINSSTQFAYVLIQVGEIIYQSALATSNGAVVFQGQLYYDGPDCTGNVYAWPFGPQPSPGVEVLTHIGKDDIFYTADINLPANLTGPLYYWSNGECLIDPGNANTYHAVPVLDVSGYTKPFRLKLLPTQ